MWFIIIDLEHKHKLITTTKFMNERQLSWIDVKKTTESNVIEM